MTVHVIAGLRCGDGANVDVRVQLFESARTASEVARLIDKNVWPSITIQEMRIEPDLSMQVEVAEQVHKAATDWNGLK